MKRLLPALAWGLALAAQAEVFTGQVIAVPDGDTLLVLRQGRPVKVRLLNIDAPEKAQPYGQESRQSLRTLVAGQAVQIEVQAVDQYGRLLVQVRRDGLDINQEQVRRGMAWEYSYRHADRTYVALQQEARQARRGLWSEANPQPPWEWRRQHPFDWQQPAQRVAEPSRRHPVMLYDMACGRKTHCRQMTSCDEARFYLSYCGVKGLDGDHDGRPCDSLCRSTR